MDKLKLSSVSNFVAPYYEAKDVMHNMCHIDRIWDISVKLTRNYPEASLKLIRVALYFHGVIHLPGGEEATITFLRSQQVCEGDIARIVRTAWDSQKDTNPDDILTIEGDIVHDAHLLEGGETFWIVKTFASGAAMGKTVEESLSYLEQHVIGQFRCLLPEAQADFQVKEDYAKDFAAKLRRGLA
ncbi:MAG: hypothetical protein WCV71_03645 [Patescibacteria group bacterium]|jgi:uncharacterized protein